MRAFLAGLWTPTKTEPATRTRVNLVLHRVFCVAFVPLVVTCLVAPKLATALIMSVAVITQLTGSYGNVQVGDMHEKDD